MAIKVYKATSNGRRNMTGSDFSEITKSKPEKTLLDKQHRKAGRNNQGRITVRHQGGGHKQAYRIIDFKRIKDDVEGVVKAIEYDPNRSANIALIHYTDGVKAYILAPKGLTVRWLGKRPTVRGSVMNPNDHPHGGGEGRAPIGRKVQMTPWGKPARGVKTRNTNARSNKLIVRHRSKKR